MSKIWNRFLDIIVFLLISISISILSILLFLALVIGYIRFIVF